MITQDATGDPKQRLRKRIGEQVMSAGSPLDPQNQDTQSAPLAAAPFDATTNGAGDQTFPQRGGDMPPSTVGLPPVGVLQQPVETPEKPTTGGVQTPPYPGPTPPPFPSAPTTGGVQTPPYVPPMVPPTPPPIVAKTTMGSISPRTTPQPAFATAGGDLRSAVMSRLMQEGGDAGPLDQQPDVPPDPGQANPNPGNFPSPPIDNHPPGTTTAPTGPDRAPAVPPAPPGGFSPAQVSDIVNGWMTSNNPFHHQDANYWIQKILSSDDFARDPQGVINYFQGRFLEDPNNNPHTGEGGGGGGAPAPAAPTGPTANDLWMQQLRDILMQRLALAGQPVDANSPGILESVTAARDEATRSGEEERKALAERLYAQGGGALGTNAINQEIQQSSERNAATVGGLRAKLIMGEVNAKRTELQQLLQMALAAGDAESARAVQMKMADLEATLRREGWGIDLAKFEADLNARTAAAGAGG